MTTPRAPHLALVSSLVALGGFGCDRAPADPAAAPTAAAAGATAEEGAGGEEAALARARAAARALGTTLKGRLLEAMAEGGPDVAARVCATEAQALTASVAEETGVAVGRSALRLRNPDNVGPPWVRAQLERWGERPAAGLAPVAEVVEAGGRRVARFVAPIETEGACLTCHGPEAGIPATVDAVLDAHYARDAARGFEVGSLRGALWAEAPVR